MIDPTRSDRLFESVPDIPQDEQGPVFNQPWEAQAFAIAMALHEQGLFEWSEWSEMLGEEITRAQNLGDPDTGATYYSHWMQTLERMVSEKGLADRDTLANYHDAWERATQRTAHGAPIELRAEDFSSYGFDLNSTGTARWMRH